MHSLISKSDLYAQKFNKNYTFTDEEAKVLHEKLSKDIRTLQGERYYSDPPIFWTKASACFIYSKFRCKTRFSRLVWLL